MKRVFEIEFPDELGPWLNEDSLLLCISTYCETEDVRLKVKNITDDYETACYHAGLGG